MFAQIVQPGSDQVAAVAKNDGSNSLSPSQLNDQINQGFEERYEVTVHD